MQTLENLKWRYATKKMDTNKKVSENDIDTIKEAIQLSASSYGLQPYKFIDVRDTELRKQLQPLCWNQPQIVEASHLLVFCNKITVTDQDVDHIVELKAQINNMKIEQLSGYGDFVKIKMKEKSQQEMFDWTAKQAYIALGNALAACAELKIDSTPMEGFEAQKVDELLGLKEQGYSACLLLAIGYRSSEDTNQRTKKVRKPNTELFEQM